MSILQTVVRFVFAAFFVFAGVSHFTNQTFFVSIVPPYLPWPSALVDISGVAEIGLGTLLMLPRRMGLARLAGWGLIALLVAVFPANIHMAVHAELYPSMSPALLWVRLPLQGVLVALAYWVAC